MWLLAETLHAPKADVGEKRLPQMHRLKTPSVLAGVLYREGAEPQRKRLPQIQSLEENKRDTKEKTPQHSSSCPLLLAPCLPFAIGPCII
jgi:hypothetical protein